MMGEKSPFQQLVENDIREVFLNLSEFAEMHIVEGKDISIVITDDQGIPIKAGYRIGVSESSIIVNAAVDDLPQRKESGETLNIDGREFTVDRWGDNDGMAVIYLNQTR